MKNEIKYFSMFTGVGGFELGFEQSHSRGQQESERKGDRREDIQREGNCADIDERGKKPRSQERCGVLPGERAGFPETEKSAAGAQPSSENSQDQSGRKGAASQSGALLHNRSDAALRSQSFKCVGVSEIDKFALRVFKHKFPGIKNYGDASKIDPKNLPDFDLLCGGFPCQAFSVAGKRGGFKDSRGTLFFEIARIIKAKRPQTVLLENVKGLLNHEGGKTFRVIVQTLGELGYDVQWLVLNSKFFGVPQNRERVFIVGSLRGQRRPQILPFGESTQASVELSGQSTNTVKTQQGPPSFVTECQQLPQTKGRPQGQRIYKTSGVSQTLIGKGGGTGGNTGIYQDGMKARRLTPRECERLQGFPEDWTKMGIDENGQEVQMSDSQRYKQMGNAVTVNVIQAIAGQLCKK